MLPWMFLSVITCCVSGASARTELSPLLVRKVGFVFWETALNPSASKKNKKFPWKCDPCRMLFRLEVACSGLVHEDCGKGARGGSGGGCAQYVPRRVGCGCDEGPCHGLAASRQKVQSVPALAEELSRRVGLRPSPSEAWHDGEMAGMCIREKVFNG